MLKNLINIQYSMHSARLSVCTNSYLLYIKLNIFVIIYIFFIVQHIYIVQHTHTHLVYKPCLLCMILFVMTMHAEICLNLLYERDI